MPRFADVIGQEMAVSALKKSLGTGSIAHAYLFTGPVGVGKMTTALAFASALSCVTEREGTDACGECWSCRATHALQHPDLTVISPTGAGDETKIDQIRDMIHSANFAPVKGKYKIAIIERAETLNAESSSSILKTLEEPPEYLIIILLAANPAVILDTIRSRCQRVRFVPAPVDLLRTRLVEEHGVAEEYAAFLASYAEGRPGRAISLIDNAAFFESRDTLLQLAGQASEEGSRWRILKLAQTLRDIAEKDEAAAAQTRKRVIAAFDTLILWYRDLLSIKLRGVDTPVINSDRLDELVRQSSLYKSPKRLAASLHALTFGKKVIAGNGNIQIATEAVLIALTR